MFLPLQESKKLMEEEELLIQMTDEVDYDVEGKLKLMELYCSQVTAWILEVFIPQGAI